MTFLAKTLFGLEETLAAELQQLGAKNIQVLNRAVSFDGDQHLLYSANLWLRTALRILKPIHHFRAINEQQLYKNVQAIDWSQYLKVNETFVIDNTVHSTRFSHSRYAVLKTKDAIVDQFRRKTRQRPSIDTEKPDLRIHLHIADNECTLSLDSSGEALYKRGYRIGTYEAPLNEVLAAGLILRAGWQADGHFVDPMCGSGTLLAEAALFAQNIPPAYYRTQFGFQRWSDFDADLWERIQQEANEQRRPFKHTIIGSDHAVRAIRQARDSLNREAFRVITLERATLGKYPPPEGKGIVITNPPYGERMKEDDLHALYEHLGTTFKHQYAGYDAWVISSNMEALRHVGLRPSRKIRLYNGSLECRFHYFPLYKGRRKDRSRD